jgi:predicted XRE-type DNA-binding protein
MVIYDQIQKFDKKYKVVFYTTDKSGKLKAQYDTPNFAGKEKLAEDMYMTKFYEIRRMKKEVLEGKISPIKLLIDLNNMSVEDIASRLKISRGKAKSHLTIKGFKKITIELLEKYAMIFDIPISEFFQFITLKKNMDVNFKNYQNKLFCELEFTTKKK